ncbi:cytochrome C [Marilutibacter spongiae]|uniref:Cytochrome C n=1 Tax=Marilutibacter spongiae TaxID=2025720 RepID=A0A7W3Y5K0_9GAMM|nr:cytochrome C [Lysobacter spongiae]MBB1060287.1 cytochrome C [Lysobacter spongiae]
MRHRSLLPIVSLSCLFAALAACQPTPPEATAGATPVDPPAPAAPHGEDPLLERGEYLVRMSGCNDCHTAGYAERQGEVDKAEWLTGSPLGYAGPWGTTYASNLRMRVDGMDEAGWLAYTANLRTRPIMPDFLLRAMAEDDRRAIYRFVKSLGPAGAPAPAYLPPGQRPDPPYMQLVLPAAPQEGPAVAASPGGR